MRVIENDLTLGDSPPPDKSPSGHSATRRTIIITVAVVITIILIASAILIDVGIVTPHHFHHHIGIISLSEIDQLAGRQLRIYGRNNSSDLKEGIILGETVAFSISNHTSSWSSSPPGVLVISLEFTNQTQSSLFYNISYMVERQFFSARNSSINIRNISYDGFMFFTVISNYSGLYAVSAGYSGNYGFVISDINVSLSSYTALVHEEIQAMTS